MPRLTKGWIADVLSIRDSLSDVTPSTKVTLLAHEAERLGVTSSTLVRLLRAARHVEMRLARTDLSLSDVRIAANAVEALLLLERRDPKAAAEVEIAALQGRITSRELAARSKAAKFRSQSPLVVSNEWTLALCEMAFRSFAGIILPPHCSAAGRWLKADLEVEVDGGLGVVFLSPRLRQSQYHGRPAGEQIVSAFAALSFFQEVVVACESVEEIKIFLDWKLKTKPTNLEIRLCNLRKMFPML